MAIDVYEVIEYQIPTHRGIRDIYNYVVPSRPEVNSNDITAESARGMIVDSWNRQFPDEPKTLDDFEFLAPPPGWVNPNS